VRGRAPDEAEAILVEVEEDRVADHVAVVVDRDELLRLVHGEGLEAVHAGGLEQLQRIGALDVEVGHVVRLVEETARLPPGVLLVAPVRELGGDLRVHVGPDLRVAGELHRIPDAL
jgi:hypothetical protein